MGGGQSNLRNAFTLIELLAIIVILAIIAVITVPIILNVIENAKKGSIQDSAYGYKDAVQKFYIQHLSEDSNFKLNGNYAVDNGKLGKYEIPINGTKPTSGKLTYENNILTSGCLVFDDYKITITNGEFGTPAKGECPIEGKLENKIYAVGEVVTNYGGYDWHVISDDGTNVTLLMDAGEKGISISSNTVGALSSEEYTQKMAHCILDNTDHTSNCTPVTNPAEGYYYVTYSWKNSLINEFLNKNNQVGDFLYNLSSQIKNTIQPVEVCDDLAFEKSLLPNKTYPGYLLNEIPEDGSCTSSSRYSVRLITEKEFDNLKLNLIDKDNSWLYSETIGYWWTMGAYNTNYSPYDSYMGRHVDTSGNWYGDNVSYIPDADSTKQYIIRPVITVQK